MSLSERLREHIAAAFTGLWVQSQEHADAITEIAELCKTNNWSLVTWDIEQGLKMPGHGSASSPDPVAAIRSINSLATAQGSALLVLPNFHRFLQSTEVMQAIAQQIQQGKQNRTFIVILSPVVQIPLELQTQFVVIEHALPGREQLFSIAREIATEPGEMPEGQELERLLDAAAGLTRFEAEGAFSLSLVRKSKLSAETIWELKSNMLKKSGLLDLHRGGESFENLGGLASLKTFCTKSLTLTRINKRARPRGILLLGIPGTGKSAFAKALGNETGRPTLVLDIGSLMGSLVGQTEERVRQALRCVDAMSPAILFVDEIEKGLAGVASSGQTDSGVSARLFGSLLTWLSDHESDVYFIGTCNDISKLPPEFSRAERFDGIFFLDTPAAAEREAIWKIHLAYFGLDLHGDRPDDRDWTGAEIKSCCRLAALLDVPLKEAARQVVPVAVTAKEQVSRLRVWASGRCLDASRPGIYGKDEGPTRHVIRPSDN